MSQSETELQVGQDIASRLTQLASLSVKIACTLPKTPPYKHLVQQLARAGTAGGANYEEARGAESRADFIHKIGVATKEVRETLYWLRLARLSGLGPPQLLDRAIDEAVQLAAILGASSRTARRNAG